MASNQPPQPLQPQPGITSGANLTIQYTSRTMNMVTISENELDMLVSLGNSTHLTFFGISVGALMAFAIELATAPMSDPFVHASFVALTGVSLLLTPYFGIRAILDYRSSRRKVREIKGKVIA